MIANRYEHEDWLVTALITATMALVFILRMLVVHFGWRSYRLGKAVRQAAGGS